MTTCAILPHSEPHYKSLNSLNYQSKPCRSISGIGREGISRSLQQIDVVTRDRINQVQRLQLHLVLIEIERVCTILDNLYFPDLG